MRKITSMVLSLLLAGSMASVWGQESDFTPMTRYSCSFEPDEMEAEWQAAADDPRNGLWTLNDPRNTNYDWPNGWEIGKEDAASGEYSMYITGPDMTLDTYSAVSCIMVAWRELTLEKGTYNIALDWKCVGGGGNKTFLRASWVPESDWDKITCGLNSEINGRRWVTDNAIAFEEGEVLHESSVWTRSVGDIESNGEPHRLVILWVNDANAPVRAPAACVDNIQIAPSLCGRPQGLTTETNQSVVTLSWQSEAETFNIKYRMEGQVEETVIEGVTGSSYELELEYGVYNFFIQPLCEGELTIWYPFPISIVYDAPLFNYLDLTSDNCYYNYETPGNWHDVRDSLLQGRIDYGYESDMSFHTIHYRAGETDIRTYGSYDRAGNAVAPLRTIPNGNLAAVRIGNWEENKAHIASVQYEFTVDAEKAKALMLRYAVVLESSGHDHDARPRFTLDVEDAETGELLSQCTSANFEPPTSANEWKVGDGWYMTNKADEIGESTVCWRDWTSVGINLAEYNERRVRVVLIAYGCTAEIHWGYAYFTLECTSGEIEGMNCGDEPTHEFIAPEGFEYAWYKKSNPNNILSTERVFPVSYKDTNTYNVELIYLSNSNCSFVLEANATPRYPIPVASYTVTQRDCKNYVKLSNTSFIRKKIYLSGDNYYYEDNNKSIRPDKVLWQAPNGVTQDSREWEPELEFPAEGGTYPLFLTCSLGRCDSIIQIDVTVPDIHSDSIYESVRLCQGDYYDYKGAIKTQSELIRYDGYNRYGCDSIHIIDLQFITRLDAYVVDTIIRGESYTFGGKEYTESVALDSAASLSHLGCDSITYLTLTVVDHLALAVDTVYHPCPEDATYTIDVRIAAGLAAGGEVLPSGVAFVFEDGKASVTIPLPEDVKPGWQTLQVVADGGAYGKDSVTAEVMVQYPNSMIDQRWNDVLGILNAEHNGGYTFVSYQWYENGVAIEGATEPYLYRKAGLNPTSEYSVELRDSAGARSVRTCAYVPIVNNAGAPVQSEGVKKTVRDGRFVIEKNGTTYDLLGVISN